MTREGEPIFANTGSVSTIIGGGENIIGSAAEVRAAAYARLRRRTRARIIRAINKSAKSQANTMPTILPALSEREPPEEDEESDDCEPSTKIG